MWVARDGPRPQGSHAYSGHHGTVYGPGPAALMRRFFGEDLSDSRFETARRRVNHLALKAQVKYRDTDVRIPALNGPAFQSLLCKLKTTLDDYEQASRLHPRVASGGD